MKAQHLLCRGFVFLFLSVSAYALAITSASAQIIYDNGVGTTGRGDYADANNPVTGGPSDVSAGDVFTAGLSGTVNAVVFSGEYYSGAPDTGDQFALNLYSATLSGPGALLTADSFSSYTQTQVGTHTTGTGAILPVYQFSGLLQTAFTLTASNTYYFSISDLTSPPANNFAVVVSDPGTTGASYLEFSAAAGTAGGYDSKSDALAFQLEDAPEPSEWALLLMGGLGLALAGRFKRSVA